MIYDCGTRERETKRCDGESGSGGGGRGERATHGSVGHLFHADFFHENTTPTSTQNRTKLNHRYVDKQWRYDTPRNIPASGLVKSLLCTGNGTKRSVSLGAMSSVA